MKYSRLTALVFGWALVGSGLAPAAAPDLILSRGKIWTGDEAHPWVEAVAIVGDKVLRTGTDPEILALADPHTQTIDLGGRMAMPGVNDSHDHTGGANFGIMAMTRRPPMADPSLGEVIAAIREVLPTAPPGSWITAGVGVSVIRGSSAARSAIDQVGGDHPILLNAWWGHGVILNTRGLAALGLDDHVTDPPGGHYARDGSGHLTGLLEEYAGSAVKRRLATAEGVPAAVKAFKAYATRRLAGGVTTVQIMGSNARLIDLEQTLVQAQTPLRLRLMRFDLPSEDQRLGDLESVGEQPLTPLIRVAGVKWVLDGTPLEQLAYQTKAYPGRPDWFGRPNFSREFVHDQLQLALNGQDQLLLHIVGDAMTDQVLEEMGKLAPPERWRPLRVRFEHGDGFVTPNRIAQAKALGLVIAQPRPGRPFRTLVTAGIPLAYGSDGGMAPFFMMAQMTNPRDPQAISREQALAILTRGSAYAEFQEKVKGTLAPGMLADVAVLSQDVMTADTDRLPLTRSVLTLVGGKVAYSALGR